jgi:hypothetical protein
MHLKKEQVNLLRHTCSVTYNQEKMTYDEWVKALRPFGYSSMLSRSKELILKEIGYEYPELMDEVLNQLGNKLSA